MRIPISRTHTVMEPISNGGHAMDPMQRPRPKAPNAEEVAPLSNNFSPSSPGVDQPSESCFKLRPKPTAPATGQMGPATARTTGLLQSIETTSLATPATWRPISTWSVLPARAAGCSEATVLFEVPPTHRGRGGNEAAREQEGPERGGVAASAAAAATTAALPKRGSFVLRRRKELRLEALSGTL